MKKKQWRFFVDGALALAAALVIAGCTMDVPEEADEAPPPGMVWVSVPAPKVERQARSLGATYSPNFVDYYEIYLRQRAAIGTTSSTVDGSEKVYFGRAFEGEVLRVAVPPNYKYDALLLAGIEKYKVLLASAFANTTLDIDPSGYIGSGEGIPIYSGQANTILFNLSTAWIESDPATDYSFTSVGTGGGTHSVVARTVDPYKNLFVAALPKKGALTSIKAVIVTKNIAALVAADDAAGVVPTCTRHTLSLKQYGTNHPVQTLVVSSPTGITGNSSNLTVEYTFNLSGAHSNWPDPNTSASNVRDQGVYARLDYTLEYYAFGRDSTDDDVTSLWKIKNSYNPRNLDKGPNTGGSSILLIIGNDPGDFEPDETVEITW